MTEFDHTKEYGGTAYLTDISIWETAAMTLAVKCVPVGESITIGVDRDVCEAGTSNIFWRYPTIRHKIPDNWDTKNVTLEFFDGCAYD